jgi:hypothetical protein
MSTLKAEIPVLVLGRRTRTLPWSVGLLIRGAPICNRLFGVLPERSRNPLSRVALFIDGAPICNRLFGVLTFNNYRAKGALTRQPRASPWDGVPPCQSRPERAEPSEVRSSEHQAIPFRSAPATQTFLREAGFSAPNEPRGFRPFRAHKCLERRIPRALPWADEFRPFGPHLETPSWHSRNQGFHFRPTAWAIVGGGNAPEPDRLALLSSRRSECNSALQLPMRAIPKSRVQLGAPRTDRFW